MLKIEPICPHERLPIFHVHRKLLRMANFMVAQLNDVAPTRCPCGWAKRAFAEPGNAASVHCVQIESDSRTHYHKRMTEIYLVLEGEGQMELDGELIPLKPMTTVYIKPGCRHRAIGKLKIVNIPVPAFDESDEWFD
jgi:mannose-6-phosphate isomerase-like protein (cupin superfamily)